MSEDFADDLVEGLSLSELEAVREAVDQRLLVLSRLPPEVARRLSVRGIQPTAPAGDGIYFGQVVHAESHLLVLQESDWNATVHHLAEPAMPVPRGEYLELVKKGRAVELSRERGKRWQWLLLDRDAVYGKLCVTDAWKACPWDQIAIDIPRTHDAVYEGPILGTTSRHILQHAGPGRFVAHYRPDLGLRPAPIGQVVRVIYHRGRMHLMEAPEHARGC